MEVDMAFFNNTDALYLGLYNTLVLASAVERLSMTL
jgi:hypothetical protein